MEIGNSNKINILKNVDSLDVWLNENKFKYYTLNYTPHFKVIDFFQNEKMGYMIESLDAKDYAGKIEHLINNTEKVNNISSFNRNYAFKHFLASDVAKELESVLMKTPIYDNKITT